MGDVYRARDSRLGRDVAIKILKEGHVDAGDRLLRFQREARAIGSLNHPHIARLYDVGAHDRTQYLVMEYLTGQSLAVRLGSGPLSLAEALRYSSETADALEHAHGIGVLHRDLKPANILITSYGAKLVDFGLAKAITPAENASTETPITEVGTIVGTYRYMAPEQFEGREADARTDVFALGAVLFEMITGRRAFSGNTVASIAAAVLHETPPPVSRFQDAPPTLDRIVRKCLAKDPAERWSTAGVLRDQLRAVRIRPDRGATARTKPPAKSTEELSPSHASRRIRVVAVLPLRNLSGDAAQEYFADGMTESLITSLAKIGAMKVISRTSVMGYKGSSKPLREIAKELKVDTILEGSVTRSHDRVGITVQLVRVTTDSPVWAEQYNRDFSDVLQVQSDVARAVAEAIKVSVTPSEKLRLQAVPKVVREAYDECLKGQFAFRQLTKAALSAAFDHFTRAIELDPLHALSYVGLARYYDAAGLMRMIPYREAFSSGRKAALDAMGLDHALGEAFGALAMVTLHEWDLRGAEQAFVQALQLDPSDSFSRQEYAKYLMYVGEFDQAISQLELAVEIDPRAPGPHTMGAFVSYVARDFHRAISCANRASELGPSSPAAQYIRGVAKAQLGEWDESLQIMLRASEASGQHPSMLASLVYIYARRGMLGEAERLVADLERRKARGEATAYDLAEAYIGVERPDRAMQALLQAYDEQVPELLGVAVDPMFAGLKELPAFRELVHRVGVA